MIKTRNRRNALRSRTSALAIAAMLATAPVAKAAGPYFINSPSCAIGSSYDTIFADSNNRSIHVTPTGSITGINGQPVDFDNSSFSGSILNQGLIAFGQASSCSSVGPLFPSDGAAVSLTNSTIPAGIFNDTTGQILSSASGVYIFNTLIGPEGGEAANQVFQNKGTIESTDIAVGLLSSSIVGTFFNGGTIHSTNGIAVSISGNYNTEGGEACVECIGGFGALEFLPTISGDLVNANLIKSDQFTAVLLSDATILGKVLNDTTGQIEAGGEGSGIWVNGSTSIGSGIENRGTITAGRSGVRFSGDAYSGGLKNFNSITAGLHGVEINVSEFDDGFTNEENAILKGGKGFGVFAGNVEGGSTGRFSGGFTNAENARISGEFGAVLMLVDNLDTGFTNVGTMAIDPHTGSGSGNGNFNVFKFETNDYVHDFDNQGTIDGRGRDVTNGAVLVANSITGEVKSTGSIYGSASTASLGLAVVTNTFIGDMNLDGLVQAGTAVYVSDVLPGGEVSGTWMSGSFTNAGTLNGNVTGAIFEFSSWLGDFTNDAGAEITGGVTGAILSGDLMSGSYLNNGRIIGGGFTTGQHIKVNTFDGAITIGAAGVVRAASLALHLEIDNLTQDILNNGLIEATDASGIAALLKTNGGSGSYTGQVVNNGTIAGGMGSGSGLKIETTIEDGVRNTGALKGKTAYDTTLATGATTFLQQGANSLVEGDMRLSFDYADDVTFEDGELKGSIFGSGGDDNVTIDVDAVAPAAVGPLAVNSFVFNGNQVTGINAFTAKSGTSLLGTTEAGVDGLGMSMDAKSVTVKSGAELYLDDNTVVNTNGLDIESGGVLTYFLTQNTEQHGVIDVSASISPPLDSFSAFAAAPSVGALAAPGVANVGGTLQIFLNDYEDFRTSGVQSFLYTGLIQTTGGLNGPFDVIAYAGSVPLGFQYVINPIYNPNSLDVEIFRNAYDELIEDPSDNQRAVGGALNDICLTAPAGSDLADFCDYVGLLDEEEIPDAYDQIGGSQIPQIGGLGLDLAELLTLPSNENNVHGTAFGTCQQAGFGWCGAQQYASLTSPGRATDAMSDEDPFAWLRPGKREVGRTGLWGRYVGNWRNVEGDRNATGLRANTQGFGGGLDHVVADDLMIGIAGLYAETTSKFAGQPEDKGDITTYQAGAYASWGDADFYVNANSTVIWNDFDTRRRIQTGPATFVFAEGDFDGIGGTAFVELGSVFEEDGFRFQPLASLFYMTHRTDEFTETGAPGLDLVVREATTESLRSQIGGRFSHPVKWGDTRIVPEIRAAWRHEFLDVRQDSYVNFVLTPLPDDLKIRGSEHSRDMAVFGVGVSASLGRSTVLYSDVDGAFSEDKTSVQASIGLRHSW